MTTTTKTMQWYFFNMHHHDIQKWKCRAEYQVKCFYCVWELKGIKQFRERNKIKENLQQVRENEKSERAQWRRKENFYYFLYIFSTQKNRKIWEEFAEKDFPFRVNVWMRNILRALLMSVDYDEDNFRFKFYFFDYQIML